MDQPNESDFLEKPSLRARLMAPCDAGGLVYFRIAFGLMMVYEVGRYLVFDRVEPYFLRPDYLFTYWPFDFVKPWPGAWLHVHFAILGVAALGMMAGFLYRVSATLVFLLFTYVFLLDKARYLNHHYLVCLIAFLMIFVPAHRTFSLDARLSPEIRTPYVPAWSIWLLRFQVGVPYFFGGIAKLNMDWVRAAPLHDWIDHKTDFPLIGPLFEYEWVAYLMAWASLALDLCVPFFLLFDRTRVGAYFVAMTFHLMNSNLFDIGIFPWTMIAATLIFFPSDWPRRIWNDVRSEEAVRIAGLLVGFFVGFMFGGWLPDSFDWVHAGVGGVGGGVLGYFATFHVRPAPQAASSTEPTPPPTIPLTRNPRVVLTLLGLWFLLQVSVPLRHYAIPGNVHWTEEGHRWAWHMKLRDKESEPILYVQEPGAVERWRVDLRDHLTSRQIRKMGGRPDMLIQFAQDFAAELRDEGRGEVEIYGQVPVSLNGRNAALLIDPEVDLTKVPRPWWPPAPWILPLEEPLRQPPPPDSDAPPES